MKNWIKNNWNTFMMGYVVGTALIMIFNLIENVIIKVALIVIR